MRVPGLSLVRPGFGMYAQLWLWLAQLCPLFATLSAYTDFPRPSWRKTCTVFQINPDLHDCGQADIDCREFAEVKAFDPFLDIGNCQKFGYTRKGKTQSIVIPVTGERVVVTEYLFPHTESLKDEKLNIFRYFGGAMSFPWNNMSLPTDVRVAALLKALSTKEKIGLMGSSSQPVSRLGVKAFNWNSEGLHGIAWHGRSTVFPAPIGLGASFDRDVLANLGAVDAREGRAKYYHNDGNGLSLFAPNINIFRDPRWGRGQETYGECPVLSGELATAFITAAQKPFLKTPVQPVLMTDKHYAVYNLESNFAPPLNGTDGQYRLRFFANASEQDLERTYLVSHAFAVEAGVAEVMCAYNAVNGLPNCANGPLLDRLRKQLGFKGVVISDEGAISFSVSPMKWTNSHVNASASALRAGTNLNLGSEFQSHLQEALTTGQISEKLIDERLRPVLSARVAVGDFDPVDPYRDWYESTTYAGIVDSPDHRHAALRAAQSSLVLLRNSPLRGEPILPLPRGMKIAVVGPNANRTDALTGNYAGCRSSPGGPIDKDCNLVTLLQGISSASQADVSFAQGVEIDSADESGIPEAALLAGRADVAILVLGLSTCQENGPMCQEAEARDRKIIGLPGVQEKLLDAVLKANSKTILVLLNGGAISGAFYTRVPAVLEAFYPGALGGVAVADALFGYISPAGRLPYTIVQSVADLPADYYSMRMADRPGRTYRYFTKEPGFAFGFGLSYSYFTYSAVEARRDSTGALAVTGHVSNVGNMTSDEVVMCFVKGPKQAGEPNIGLVGFTRVFNITPGSTRSFVIHASARGMAAANVPTTTSPKQVYVGGRAPGSAGAWADLSTAPAAPLVVVPTDAFVSV